MKIYPLGLALLHGAVQLMQHESQFELAQLGANEIASEHYIF